MVKNKLTLKLFFCVACMILIWFVYKIYFFQSSNSKDLVKGNEISRQIEELRVKLEKSYDDFPSLSLYKYVIKKEKSFIEKIYSSDLSPEFKNFLGEKLYRIGASLNEYKNKLAGKMEIPIYENDSHGRAAHHWIGEYLANKKSRVLIHFDSHADMGFLCRPNDLKYAMDMLKKENNIKWWMILKSGIYDIAQPVTAGIFLTDINKVIWIHDSWAKRYPVFNELNFYLGSSKNVNAEFSGETLSELFKKAKTDPENFGTNLQNVFLDCRDKYDNAENDTIGWQCDILEHILNEKYTPGNWMFEEENKKYAPSWINLKTSQIPETSVKKEKEYKYWNCAINKYQPIYNFTKKLLGIINNNEWILDIDLDFFACEGFLDNEDEIEEEQKLVEPISTQRASEMNWPEIETEKKAIDRRLHIFEEVLKGLKKYGKVPNIITIAGSVGVEPFDSAFFDIDDYLDGGQFTPVMWVEYIKMKVYSILHKLYPQTTKERKTVFSKEYYYTENCEF